MKGTPQLILQSLTDVALAINPAGRQIVHSCLCTSCRHVRDQSISRLVLVVKLVRFPQMILLFLVMSVSPLNLLTPTKKAKS
jgi:hypothetical protein